MICGIPLYEYEHMDGWATVQEHVADRITLLCDRHHRERTNGLLTVEQVEQADSDPINHRTGAGAPYSLHYEGTDCSVEIGSNRFTATGLHDGQVLAPVVVDGQALLSFQLLDGHLLLNLTWYDESNQPVLEIRQNQLLHSTEPWDIELVGRRLVIREAARKILLDVEFDPPNGLQITRGRFLFNGVDVLIKPNQLSVGSSTFTGNLTVNCTAGIVIGPVEVPGSCAIRLVHVSRRADTATADEWWNEVADTGGDDA